MGAETSPWTTAGRDAASDPCWAPPSSPQLPRPSGRAGAGSWAGCPQPVPGSSRTPFCAACRNALCWPVPPAPVGGRCPGLHSEADGRGSRQVQEWRGRERGLGLPRDGVQSSSCPQARLRLPASLGRWASRGLEFSRVVSVARLLGQELGLGLARGPVSTRPPPGNTGRAFRVGGQWEKSCLSGAAASA